MSEEIQKADFTFSKNNNNNNNNNKKKKADFNLLFHLQINLELLYFINKLLRT